MKLSEINNLGVSKKTLDESHINVSSIITSDEFNKPIKDEGKRTYRDRALERLLSLKIPFNSNMNIFWEMFEKLVLVYCPQCKDRCRYTYGGGGDNCTIQYQCINCNFICSFTLPADGISVRYK